MNFLSSHPAFNETIDSLKNEFKEDKSNNLVICGAHDFSRTQNIEQYKKKYDKVIVFNQEPLTATQRQFMHQGYFSWIIHGQFFIHDTYFLYIFHIKYSHINIKKAANTRLSL